MNLASNYKQNKFAGESFSWREKTKQLKRLGDLKRLTTIRGPLASDGETLYNMKNDINELVSAIIETAEGWEIAAFHAALVAAIVSVENALGEHVIPQADAESATDRAIAFERKQARIELERPSN